MADSILHQDIPDGSEFLKNTRKNALDLRRMCDNASKEMKKYVELLLSAKQSEMLFNSFIAHAPNHEILKNISDQLCAIREKRGIHVTGESGKLDKQKAFFARLSQDMANMKTHVASKSWISKERFISKLQGILGKEICVTEEFAHKAKQTSVEMYRMMQNDAQFNGVQAAYLGANRKRSSRTFDDITSAQTPEPQASSAEHRVQRQRTIDHRSDDDTTSFDSSSESDGSDASYHPN